MARERKRQHSDDDSGLGGLFRGIGSLIDLVAKMTEEGKQEHTQSGEIKGLPDKVKGVYGFTVRMGLGGRPTVEQFGNIKTTAMGAVVEEVREPIVDVFDEGEYLLVIAELPGVERSGLRLRVQDDILDLEAEGQDKRYRKELLLPSEVDPTSIQSDLKNGILELKLLKAKRPTGTGG